MADLLQIGTGGELSDMRDRVIGQWEPQQQRSVLSSC